MSWHFFADDEEPIHEENQFTFYNARGKSSERTGRTEWRLYYYGEFVSHAGVGDLMILAQAKDGRYFGLIFREASAWQRAARQMFALMGKEETTFSTIPEEKLTAQRLEFFQQQIFRELDLELVLPSATTDEDLMLSNFGERFPPTQRMSQFAREQVDADPTNCDDTLTRWLEREEQLFRALEKVIIGKRLQQQFATVDDFIQYSLSVQNTRKSRMGFSLQNHLAHLFAHHKLRFDAQARTEAKNKPDFIFPGQKEYHDAAFDASLLVMLAAKSTSKDRWRQILPEAEKIPSKHLCTLEPGISVSQTEEMRRHRVTLVIPESLHRTYTESQRLNLWSVADFVTFVRQKQHEHR